MFYLTLNYFVVNLKKIAFGKKDRRSSTRDGPWDGLDK